MPRAEDHHGLALDADESLGFQVLQHPSHHLPGTAHDAPDLLAGDADLHAVGVGHGIGLLAQVQERAGHAAGDVEEGEVAHLAAGAEQPVRELLADSEEKLLHVGFQLVFEQGLQPLVADLGNLAGCAGADDHGAGGLAHEHAHLADELLLVEIGENDLLAVLVLEQHGELAVENVHEGVRRVTGLHQFLADGILVNVAMGEEGVEPIGRGWRQVYDAHRLAVPL